jgi:WD40 repeat protein
VNHATPHYKLARVDAEGAHDFEIVPIVDTPVSASTGRRGFFGSALSATSVLAITACASPPPPPRPTPVTRPAPPSAAAASPPVARVPTPAPPPRPQPVPAPTPVQVASLPECGPMRSHLGAVKSLALIDGGSRLLSGSVADGIKLWALPEGRLLKFWPLGAFLGFVVAPDGQTVAVMSNERRVELRSLPAWTLVKTVTARIPLLAAAFAPDGKTLYLAGLGSGIETWSLSGATAGKSIEHIGNVSALVVSPDGRWLVAGGTTGSIRIYSLPDGGFARKIDARSTYVRALAITRDSQSLLVAGTNIETFGLHDGGADRLRVGTTVGATAIGAAPDNEHFFTGHSDSSIRVWSLLKPTALRQIRGHGGEVGALAIGADGVTLATGSADQTVRLGRLDDKLLPLGCLVDAKATPNTAKGITYQQANAFGQTITYTLPCGSPIPAGATCTCNCVSGGYSVPVPVQRSGSYTVCTCNKVCVCIPVCQAHRLCDPDPFVRRLARGLLLWMGEAELEYMDWARRSAGSAPLAAAIAEVMRQVRSGLKPWSDDGLPSRLECERRLEDADPLIALMAAQALRWQRCRFGLKLDPARDARVDDLLSHAGSKHWRLQGAG